MKRITRCKECDNIKYEEIICDQCGENTTSQGIKISYLKLNMYNTDYDFCTLRCAINFLVTEHTKVLNAISTDILYGSKKKRGK